MDGTLGSMIEAAEAALEAGTGYSREGINKLKEEDRKAEREMYLRDLGTDLHHWCDQWGIDFDEVFKDDMHYEAEKGTPLDEVPTA